MSGRFLSPKDISAARHEMEAINSLAKRGELRDTDLIQRYHHIVCGCGAEGCIFIRIQRREKDKEKT
jgi:hypothetical protein